MVTAPCDRAAEGSSSAVSGVGAPPGGCPARHGESPPRGSERDLLPIGEAQAGRDVRLRIRRLEGPRRVAELDLLVRDKPSDVRPRERPLRRRAQHRVECGRVAALRRARESDRCLAGILTGKAPQPARSASDTVNGRARRVRRWIRADALTIRRARSSRSGRGRSRAPGWRRRGLRRGRTRRA